MLTKIRWGWWLCKNYISLWKSKMSSRFSLSLTVKRVLYSLTSLYTNTLSWHQRVTNSHGKQYKSMYIFSTQAICLHQIYTFLQIVKVLKNSVMLTVTSIINKGTTSSVYQISCPMGSYIQLFDWNLAPTCAGMQLSKATKCHSFIKPSTSVLLDI